jgi:hypothetical protein
MVTKFSIYIISILFSVTAFTQETIFHKDSLLTKSNRSFNLQKIPVEILKGIVAADYKKLGWNEYIPKDGLEFPDIPLKALKSHPRLITEIQIKYAIENIRRQPFRQWYGHLKNAPSNINSSLFNPLFKVADRIKMIAFLYKIEGEKKYLRQLEGLLSQIPNPPLSNNVQGGIVGQGWGDFLESAQAINSLCVALDLTFNELDEAILEATLQKMFIRTDQILHAFAYTPANNHLLVMGISLLEMAMLIDQPENYIAYNRHEIWNAGWGHVSRALGLISPDGGYAEGVDYARFILNYLAPFSIHLYNNTGLRLFDNPILIRMLNWVMANDKGNGIYAKFDDALNGEAFIYPLVIPFSSQGARYNKYFKTLPQSNRAIPNMVEGLSVYQDLQTSFINDPDNVQFYPDMGQAVFKDNFFNPSIFVSILGERERWFADRHEHIDPLAIELNAFGEDILIDAGYGQWTSDYNRTSWYTTPFAHNGILIDGLGTYRNPIWGDSTGCRMVHAFQTPTLASATMHTQIQNVNLSRKTYFIQNRFVFIVDHVEASRNHSVALNFNHSGDLVQLSSNRMHIKQNNATLEISYGSTEENPAIVTKNFGLQTPPTHPATEISSFKIEQPQMKNGYFVTLMVPRQINNKDVLFSRNPVKGRGQSIKITSPNSTYSEMEYAVNHGIMMETAEWKSDSRVLFIDHGSNHNLQSILLIEFTYFKYGNISIKSTAPVTLYLERNKSQWLGYIESSDDGLENRIEFDGLIIFPARFNHQLLDNNSLIQNDVDSYIIFIQGSGSLEFGIGSQSVKMSYRYHNSSNFLSWVKRRFELGLNYNNLSDLDRQMLKNQIAGNMFRGVQKSAEYWSQKFFNDPDVFNHIANATGLMQETISDMTNSTIDIAHRYTLNGKWGDSKWKVSEDGMITEKGLRFRNLSLESFDKAGQGMNYQYLNFYPEHQSHAIRLHSNHQNFIYYQFAETDKNKEQQVQLQFQKSDYFINPGYAWNQNSKNKHVFLNGRMKNFDGGFSHSSYNGEDSYYESLSAYGENWAFAAEGEQTQIIDNYTENLVYFLSPQFNVTQGVDVSKQNDWNLDSYFVDMNYTGKEQTIRGRYLYNQNKSYQNLFYYLSLSNFYVSSQINLNEFQFGKENQFLIESGIQFENDFQYYTNTSYQHDKIDAEYKTIVYQQVWIPFGKYTYLNPILEFQLPDNNPYNWIGGGVTYTGRFPFFVQILINNNSPNLLDYQFSIQEITLFPNSNMLLWLHVQQQKDEIQNTEIRIQNTSTIWQPGLYYLYNRYFGSRWEGYLEWYW